MKKIFLTLLCGCVCFIANAQDIIVKKDGTTIQAKVVKIGSSEVEYKKWTRQDGPSYTISMSELLAINYPDGEEETFNTSAQSQSSLGNLYVPSEKAVQDNLQSIKTWNSTTHKYIGKNRNRQTDCAYWIWGIRENSQLLNDDISISFTRCSMTGKHKEGTKFNEWEVLMPNHYIINIPGVGIVIENKSDRMVFVDLGASSFVCGNQANSLYTAMSSTTSNGSGSGVGMSLGVFNPVLSGISVGSTGSNTYSNTVYSQRVISIPPHCKAEVAKTTFFPFDASLSYKEIEKQTYGVDGVAYKCNLLINQRNAGKGDAAYKLNCNLENPEIIKEGVVLKFTEANTPINFGTFISYSFDENLIDKRTLSTSIYVKEVMGISDVSSAGTIGDVTKLIDDFDSGFGLFMSIHKKSKEPKMILTPSSVE